MNLYFIKNKNQYLSKVSTLGSHLTLVWTYHMHEARYWDNSATVKGQLTKIRATGINAYISVGSIIEGTQL